MTKLERRENRLERLFWELRGKYLAASNVRLTCHDIMWDISGLKKFHGLTPQEKADLCVQAVEATDGHESASYLIEEATETHGSLAAFFA